MPHVLLFEDDPAVLQQLRATAKSGGLTSSQAVSAAEVVRRIIDEAFDAILLDTDLPDLAASHLIEEIRDVSDIPVIVVSGQSDEPTIVAALNAGADDFVTKPFLPSDLLARIRVAIGRYAALYGEPVAGAAASSSSLAKRRTIKPGHWRTV